jgi:hypothetical protein
MLNNFQISDLLKKQLKKPNLKEIFYLLKYSSIEYIDEFDFMNFVGKIKDTIILDTKNTYFINRVIRLVKKIKLDYRSDINQDYFILSNTLNLSNKIKIEKYFTWLYIEISFNEIIKNNKERNLLISRFYRFSSIFEINFENRKKLLLNAFYILSNPALEIDFPIIIDDNKIRINTKCLVNNPNSIGDLDKNKEHYLAHVSEKHYQGFKLNIDDCYGFLPTQNIYDLSLKHQYAAIINWKTNVK